MGNLRLQLTQEENRKAIKEIVNSMRTPQTSEEYLGALMVPRAAEIYFGAVDNIEKLVHASTIEEFEQAIKGNFKNILEKMDLVHLGHAFMHGDYNGVDYNILYDLDKKKPYSDMKKGIKVYGKYSGPRLIISDVKNQGAVKKQISRPPYMIRLRRT